MKKRLERLIIVISVIVVIGLFVFFLKSVMIPFIRFELKHDIDGARDLLRGKGIIGFFAVAIVEALQMVVVFIPAEFIQISSGLSYPFPIALALCDIGVCLGATIIFILVRNFRFSTEAYNKNKKKIDALASGEKSDRGIILFMYFLFFMPLIPFGAICYYASNTGIKYGKYILTVATGVIPSIVTSNLMGAAGKAFIRYSIPIPLLVLIIILLAAVLFIIIYIFLDKIYFKENDGTPDSIVYTAAVKVIKAIGKRKQRLKVDNTLLKNADEPYFMLLNHESFYDFMYLANLSDDLRAEVVANEYYLSKPLVRKIAKKMGLIPKKLFTNDLHTVGKIISTIKKGYSVVIFPEGRLSTSGRPNPDVTRSGGFYKRLGRNLVLTRITGAYYAKPKWRKRTYRSDISIKVERVIKAEELRQLTADEIDSLIKTTLYCDEPCGGTVYRQKDKAKGLENILYRCVDCGTLYSTVGKGCDLICTHCGKVRHIGSDYRFDDGTSIADVYDMIAQTERENIEDTVLETEVKTKIFGRDGKTRKETGVCRLDKNEFSYRSANEEFSISTKDIPALAYSCNEEFELYHNDELHYFYPVDNRKQTVRWALLIDILTEARNGK